MPDNGKFFEILIDVLGYREDGDWVALALEMDLRGHGGTFEEAVDDLLELIEMQISFAVQKGQPEMIWKPAEPVWYARWAEERRQRFFDSVASRDVSEAEDYRVGAIPPPHVIASMSEEFCRVDA